MTDSRKHLTENPKLRWPLDVQRHQHQGEEFVVLSCPLGLSVEPAIFSGKLLPVIFSLDGSDTSSIVEQFQSAGLTLVMLEKLILRLDEFNLLETARTKVLVQDALEDYRKTKLREPAHAGFAYPAEPAVLSAQISEWLNQVESEPNTPDNSALVSVVPHIDYGRGWSCYADLFQNFSVRDNTTIILFGTSHQPGSSLFRLTSKNFQIPGFEFETCSESVKYLANMYGDTRSFVDELVHRKEHSIELVLPFLAQRVLDSPGLRIVPILVGGFQSFLGEERDPETDEEFRCFVESLKSLILELEEKGRNWKILAGLDMAHVGLAFGDSEPVAPTGLEALESRDREYLALALASDSKKFLAHLSEDLDARRICGYPSLFTIFSLFESIGRKIEGELVSYHQAVEENSDTIVTFSSMNWYQR